MERIDGQMRGLRTLAKRVLSWITCARRPLETEELRHGLAVKEGDRMLDQCNLRDISDMVSVCAGLVTVDEQSKTIRLVHYTAQEYFKETRDRWFEDPDLDIANTCATFLAFEEFTLDHLPMPSVYRILNEDKDDDDEYEGGVPRIAEDMRLRRQLDSIHFYNYAARNWGHHARECSTAGLGEISRFLGLQRHVKVSIKALSGDKAGWLTHLDFDQWTPLHLTAHFGAEEVMRMLLRSHDPDARDGAGWTALAHAASMGWTGVARALLESGADIEARGKYGRKPLCYAVRNSNEALVRLLLDHGANADIAFEDGIMPLDFAAARGHPGVVELLLRGGADARGDADAIVDPPLYYAGPHQHWRIVQLILDHGA